MKRDSEDRRIRRTRESLQQAMFHLMREKKFAAITVQEIIDRANVGRSTFYVHFRDKDQLAVSCFEGMLDAISRSLEEEGGRLLPVRELFGHVQEQYPRLRSLISREMLDLFFEKGQAHWAGRLESRLGELATAGEKAKAPIPIVAHYLAGTMFTLLKWWLENKTPYSPDRMEQIVRDLVMPSLQATMGIEKLP